MLKGRISLGVGDIIAVAYKHMDDFGVIWYAAEWPLYIAGFKLLRGN